MNRSFKRFLQLTFILLDVIILNIIYLIAQGLFEEDPQSHYYLRYTQYWFIMNGFWIGLSWLGRVYATDNITLFESFLKASIRVYAIWAFLNIAYLLLPRVIQLSASLVFTTIFLFLIGLFLNRLIYLSIKEWVKREVHLNRRILILGHNSVAKKLASYLEKQRFGIQIMGYVDDKAGMADSTGHPFYNNIENALQLSKELKVT